jgi:hypothetical protein
MIPYKPLQLYLLCSFMSPILYAQEIAAVKHEVEIADTNKHALKLFIARANKPFPATAFFIPAICIAYGFTSLNNGELKEINKEIKDELYLEEPHKKFGLDNYLQFTPAAMVYGLNAAGIKGKHNFADRSIIYGMSNIILAGTVCSLKKITAEQRPDGSARSSFPSGHTAEAFASAEFLRQEYRDVSPWYGVAGYAMAATTGYLRMYNNRHWLSDIVAGAGIGIASTKISYWLYPKIQQKIFKRQPANMIVMPTYKQGSIGLSMVKKF